MMVFHIDCKKLILRVWTLSWKKFHDLDPKHGSIKDYIIRYIKPTQIIQGKENTIFENSEWEKTALFSK